MKQYINQYKKTPSIISKKKEEKQLGSWLFNQKTNYKNKEQDGMKNEKRYQLWTDFLEEYKEYFISDEEQWTKTFEELKQYINQYKKTPSKNSKKKEEKQLGSWLSAQKKNYKNKEHGMKDEKRYQLWTDFLEEYKEYFISDEEQWTKTFEELKQYINQYKKTPSKNSKKKEEKQLGSWLSAQKKNYKNKEHGMKDEKRYQLWTDFLEEYKEYFISDEEQWTKTFEELKQYINQYKKTPSSTSKKKEEKQLGLWLSNQKTNYKKKQKGMKDEKRYQLWSEFLEEYKEYFNSKEYDNSSIETSSLLEEEEEYVLERKIKPNVVNQKTNIIIEEDSEHEEEYIIPLKPKKSMKLKEIKPIIKESKETSEQTRERKKSELSLLHQKYKTMSSQNLQKEFQKSPELWHQYHTISEENEKSFPEEEIPRNRIIQELNEIKGKRTRLVVDMGCGKAQISNHFSNDKRFKFINFDHVSCGDNVLVQDISNVSLEDHSIEICILCLAMWGSNCHDYVKEAYRILESGGKLYIIEATKRWTNENGQASGKLENLLKDSGFNIVKSSIEKFTLFICSKE